MIFAFRAWLVRSLASPLIFLIDANMDRTDFVIYVFFLGTRVRTGPRKQADNAMWKCTIGLRWHSSRCEATVFCETFVRKGSPFHCQPWGCTKPFSPQSKRTWKCWSKLLWDYWRLQFFSQWQVFKRYIRDFSNNEEYLLPIAMIKKMNFAKNGFTLVEMLIALAISAIIISAAFGSYTIIARNFEWQADMKYM